MSGPGAREAVGIFAVPHKGARAPPRHSLTTAETAVASINRFHTGETTRKSAAHLSQFQESTSTSSFDHARTRNAPSFFYDSSNAASVMHVGDRGVPSPQEAPTPSRRRDYTTDSTSAVKQSSEGRHRYVEATLKSDGIAASITGSCYSDYVQPTATERRTALLARRVELREASTPTRKLSLADEEPTPGARSRSGSLASVSGTSFYVGSSASVAESHSHGGRYSASHPAARAISNATSEPAPDLASRSLAPSHKGCGNPRAVYDRELTSHHEIGSAHISSGPGHFVTTSRAAFSAGAPPPPGAIGAPARKGGVAKVPSPAKGGNISTLSSFLLG